MQSEEERYEKDSEHEVTSNYLVQTPFSNKNAKGKSAQMGSNQLSTTGNNQAQFDLGRHAPRQRLNFDSQHPGTSPARSAASGSVK